MSEISVAIGSTRAGVLLTMCNCVDYLSIVLYFLLQYDGNRRDAGRRVFARYPGQEKEEEKEAEGSGRRRKVQEEEESCGEEEKEV